MRYEEGKFKYVLGEEYFFAGNLKLLRLARKGLTQGKLADILGVNRKTYSQYEQGKRIPPALFMYNVAEYFYVDIDRLVGERIIPGIKESDTENENIAYTNTQTHQ